MKRISVLPLLAAAFVFGVSTAWGAAPTEPPASLACLNIDGGTGFSWDGATLSGSITLAAPACKQATYSLFVLDQSGDTTPLTSAKGTPVGGGDVIFFSTAVSDTDGMVCVYATSSIGGRVFDVGAPEGQQCLVVDNSGTAGGTPFH
jgi:hypothetical protein